MHRGPATPATGLIDSGMPEFDALGLSDVPDADTADPADLSSHCGCIGIDIERRDNRRALFRRNPIIAAAARFQAPRRRDGLGLDEVERIIV
jgi:hypothetical protein